MLPNDLMLHCKQTHALHLSCRAEGVRPCVTVVEPRLDFPETYIGGGSKMSFTLKNSTPVAATLLADFTAMPEFQLLLSREAWAAEGYEVCPVQKIGANGEMSTMGSKRVSRR
jgi:hypothetical protein